jgi:RNA polymerase sigma-70 factor (ECF subfamily)
VESDRDLIERARDGSPEALASLYRRYWPLSWQWAYAITGSRERADDLAQTAILAAVDALPSFDVSRPFGAWLKRIVINAGIDEIRRLRRGPVPLDWFVDRLHAATDDDEARFGGLVEAVASLAPARRHVIVLHYWLDLQVDEVAALLGLPFGTVASRLSRGLADLREALTEHHV